jgi:tetratricopeptide (TPR) repeat protein
MSDKTSWWQKITLVVFGLLFTVMLLEAGLRLGGFMARSAQEYKNRQSLQQKGTCRIMCIGESTTAGQYPPHLEKALDQRHAGIQFSVIDKGVAGINSANILARLESNLDQYHPDMVVVMMGSNDQGILYYKDIPEAQTKLFYYCKTYRLIRLLWVHILAKAREIGASKKTIVLNPQNDDAYIRLGWICQVQGKLSQDEDAFKKAIALNPQNADAYVELGWLYRDQGKLSQAEDSFKQAIERDPQNNRAYAALGVLYRDQGKLSQAEDAFKKAIERSPKKNRIYAELGGLYRDQGKLSQAEDLLKQAVSLGLQNNRAYAALGALYRDQGKLSQAEDAYKQAIERDPKDNRAYTELGGLYRDQGKLSQVEALFKQAIALNPQNDRAYGALSVLYEEMGKSGLAKEYAQKAASLRLGYCVPFTVANYRTLKEILDKKGIRLVCMQYPMRSIKPLKRIFQDDREGIIFVDNEKLFKEAVKKDGYNAYFKDIFGGDFGHCTDKGNRLLAENIANTILKEAFHK